MIRFSAHVLFRMSVRSIPKKLVLHVVQNPKMVLYDVQEENMVALGIGLYRGKRRWFAIPHTNINQELFVITAYPISAQQINNRIASGRWKDEEF